MHQQRADHADSAWIESTPVVVRALVQDNGAYDHKIIRSCITLKVTGIKKEEEKQFCEIEKTIFWYSTRKLPLAVGDTILLKNKQKPGYTIRVPVLIKAHITDK